jgi:hypothetical protein
MDRFRPGVAPAFEELVARTLAVEPAIRPTALELAVSLARLAESVEDAPSPTQRLATDAVSTLDITVERWDPPETK